MALTFKNTVKVMLGGLLLIVCGSLFAHDFSLASTENVAEDTSTSMTTFHSVLGYSLILIAVIYIRASVLEKAIKMAGVTVSILVCFQLLQLRCYGWFVW